ncbi:MAG: DNA polymerase III subunit alpha [Clostridia bacterium]|nr:DNA polymerase III subunit alpha [Clostridia bacterium]
MAFTHLHVHTEYSLLDGASRIKDLVAKAKEMGMTSLAITDHGNMFGVIEFYKECKAQGIKPILGCEVYTSARTRFDKDPVKDKKRGHLILLAENETGYKNLMKIVSRSYTEGFYYKARVDKDLLREYSEGIICLSACLAGNIQKQLLFGNYEAAKAEALDLIDIFGKENFYLEIQDQGLEEEMKIRSGLISLSKELDVPLVATNDVHYVNREDAEAQDILMCIQMQKNYADENRMRFPNDQFYLKSESEMRKIFASMPEVIDRTEEVANRCNVEITFGEYHIPIYDSPDGMTNSEHLRKLCLEGFAERYGDEASLGAENYKELMERLEYEISVIENMGFVGYFLIVWDFINYAKTHGIMVGPGRGSAAGSIVAYCLHITDIDPIKHKLIFERFLNPARATMPDIDVDFCIERRGEVIDYVVKKYGRENVSQIITFGRLKAKAAIRDVGRVLEVSYAFTDQIAKAVPNDLNITLDRALEISPELKHLYETSEEAKKVIDVAKAIEGLPRNSSTHAAGVVISREAIDNYVPLFWSESKGASTQFTMTTIEELGLLKMDFLGLRNLTIIRDALELIKKRHGIDLDFGAMDYDDPAVYEMIASGNTAGVFQLESGGMTQFMKNLKPTCFEDIVAGISLYRPGPMDSIPKYIDNKKNPGNITYVDEQLAPILDVTYGCLVYQEQVMQIVRDLGGYSYGRSDEVRRYMSKKKHDKMMEEKEYFINGKLDENGNVEIPGCIRNGVSRQAAETIFEDMTTFASYAFNKSHAAAYAVVAYETGYLKVHYPQEYMAALLSSVMGDGIKTSKYIRDAQEMGVEVLPPDVNSSELKYTVTDDGKIRYGLLGIKGLGQAAIDNIVEVREKNGKFTDFFKFVNSLDVSKVNKKALEALIKAGAIDSIHENRAALLQIYDRLLESAQKEAKTNIAGQVSLFSLEQDDNNDFGLDNIGLKIPDIENFDKDLALAMEKEYTGVYLTDHPLNKYKEALKLCNIDAAVLQEIAEDNKDIINKYKDGQRVSIGGLVTSVKTIITKKQQMMAFVTIEDLLGEVEIILFPETYGKYKELIAEDSPIFVNGTLNYKEDEAPKILVSSVAHLNDAVPVKLRLSKDMDQQNALKEIEKIISQNPGKRKVVIFLANGKALAGGDNMLIDFMLAEHDLVQLLGRENVKGK